MTDDTTTGDLLELRRAHPAPAAITLSDDHRASLRARVDASVGRQEARRRVLIGVGAPATVLACATAVATLVVLALTGQAPTTAPPTARDIGASFDAAQVLERVADRALAASATTVRADQFVYTRSSVISNEGTLGGPTTLGTVHEREIWFGQDPDAFGWRDDLIREYGQDWPLDYSGPASAGPTRPTYAWLGDLPTDPDDLLDALEPSAVPVDGQDQGQATFDLIGNLVSEQLLPPETAAALYRAVTRIPGIEVDRSVTDALGRRGVGISRTDERFRTRTAWIFDAETYALLGTRWWFTHRDGSPDTLFGATAVLESAVVDAAGVAPGSDA